jgi:hypothetical protein
MEISSFFIAWFYLGIVSLIILPLRSDWAKIQIDFKRLFFNSWLHFVISSIMAYLFMPFILLDSLINIYRSFR